MATKGPKSGSVAAAPTLPDRIGPADLDALNQVMEALLVLLRHARDLSVGERHEREGAVVAVHAVLGFLTRFESVLAESLHVPFLSLHSALLALDDNNVEPILKPANRRGRAASSPRHSALIGIAVGASRQLEWTGLSQEDANIAVATKLNALGIKPARGKGDVTANTVRRWREKIDEARPLRSVSEVELSAKDKGWITADINASQMLTEEERVQLAAFSEADARRFILDSLEASVRTMRLAGPLKPYS